MNAYKFKNGLPTGVTVEQVRNFIAECGEDYIHYDNEQYSDNGGMRERIIAIHKDAKVFYSKNEELGRFFGFSQEEADKYFAKASLKLYK